MKTSYQTRLLQNVEKDELVKQNVTALQMPKLFSTRHI